MLFGIVYCLKLPYHKPIAGAKQLVQNNGVINNIKAIFY